jgi:hypothetical protein
MTTKNLQRRARVLLALVALAPGVTNAADLPDPPEIPPELLPHCTWNWNKVDMSRFEIRDGLVCAGKQCIDEGFYDPWSLEACGMSSAVAEDMLWAHIVRPGKWNERFVKLRDAVAALAQRRQEATERASAEVERCMKGFEEVALLSSSQASDALRGCEAGLAAVTSGSLPASEASSLKEAQSALRARVAATGGK